MHPGRLILINGLIRVASAASGQLFAFVLAERVGTRPGTGSLLVGLIAACFYITELAGAPLAGRIADARGQLRVLRWGPLFGIVSVLTGAAAALGSLPVFTLAAVLVAARISEGASAACAVPTTLVLLSRETDGHAKRRLRVMGLFEITSLVGLILGYLVAGAGWDALGPTIFLLLPVVYGLAWLLARGRDDTRPALARRAAHVWHTVQTMARARGAVPFAIAWLAVNAVVGVWLQQAPYLFKLPIRSASQVLVGGYSGSTIGVIFAVWGLTFLVGVALWSLAAPRWPRRRILAVALGGMLIVVASLWLTNHGAWRGLLVIAVAGVLVESGFTPAAFAHLADITDAHESSRGAAMGFYSLLLGLGQLIGVAIGAPFAARWQMDGVLLVTALFAMIALAGVARMKSEEPGSSPR